MTPEQTITAVRECIERWAAQQGHDRCWYYPEVFKLVAELVGARVNYPKNLPPKTEFDTGCLRYSAEQYKDICHKCGGSGKIYEWRGPPWAEISCPDCWRTKLEKALKP